MSEKAKKIHVFFDMDKAVELWNEKTGESFSKADLAREIGMPYKTLDNYQNGKLPVAFGYAEVICELTGIKKECLIKTKE